MPTFARLGPIAYYLPETLLTNEELVEAFGEWTPEQIREKTGISVRHVATADETAADLAAKAAEKLFASGVDRDSIDFVLLCTQSPDYWLPTSACVLQDRLGLRTGIGALDFNLGCSGFIYGLGLAKGLIESRQATRVLLLTAETYSKFIHPRDKSVRTLFGDAAAAAIIEATEADEVQIGPFVYGTDGRGAGNLIVRTGASRQARGEETGRETEAESGNVRSLDNLYMNGPEIFNFTLLSVPASVRGLLEASGRSADEIDLYVFHQANQFMLEHLRRKIKIPKEKFPILMEHSGNTVSATIPIALAECVANGVARPGMLAMLVGFGVGYSWGATLVRV